MTTAYGEPSQKALGFFLIHVAGKSYGVRAPDASLLACSFDEVVRRVGFRGKHTAPFSDAEALAVARSFREAIYDVTAPTATSVGMSYLEFEEIVRSNHIVWAPDGDEAFDDGSYVLQFDTRDGVRLIVDVIEE